MQLTLWLVWHRAVVDGVMFDSFRQALPFLWQGVSLERHKSWRNGRLLTLGFLAVLGLLVLFLEDRRRRVSKLNLALLVAYHNLGRVGQNVNVEAQRLGRVGGACGRSAR